MWRRVKPQGAARPDSLQGDAAELAPDAAVPFARRHRGKEGCWERSTICRASSIAPTQGMEVYDEKKDTVG